MSYLVLHMDKFKKEAVRGIQSHNQRERPSKSNPDIDYEKSGQNYDLYNSTPVNFNKVINSRIDELKLKKSPRHDAVLMCGLVLSSDKSFFNGLSDREQRRFFLACKEFLEDFTGRENVISAIVHMDEKTPHLHFTHVPVTKDGRLSAKNIYTRESLKQLQSDLPRYLQSRGFNIERGVEQKSGAIKKHLDTREYKQQKEAEKVVLAKVNAAKSEVEAIQAKIAAKQSALKVVENLANEAEQIMKEKPNLPKVGLWVSKKDYEQAVNIIEIQQQAMSDKNLIKAQNEAMKKRETDLDKIIEKAIAETENKYLQREQAAKQERDGLLKRVGDLERIIKTKDDKFKQYSQFMQNSLKDYQRLKELEEKKIEAQKQQELLQKMAKSRESLKQEQHPSKKVEEAKQKKLTPGLSR